MRDQIDNFIAEIRNSPEYIAAAAESGVWAGHIGSIEYGLNEIARQSSDNPAMAESLDKVMAIICDDDQHLGQRLNNLGMLVARLHEIKGALQ
jgi:hypothetical protein